MYHVSTDRDACATNTNVSIQQTSTSSTDGAPIENVFIFQHQARPFTDPWQPLQESI